MAGVGISVFGILASISFIQESKASCPPGQFGDSCSYFCHCDSSCDLTTGFCVGDCDVGWAKGGGMCQKENVALKRSATTTSGTYGDWKPSGAVDGNTWELNHASSCFHANGTPSDWTVDLGGTYQLYDILVYARNRFFYRIANSTIYLDNNTSRICFTFPSSSNVNPTDVTCNGTARYVTIRNQGTNFNNGVLNVCEVMIYACSNGTYGVNCDSFCHCSDCDRWTGICFGDCRPGWQGERCDIECESNITYGVDCSKNCFLRNCHGISSCDRFTGSCDTRCLAGWLGDDCTTAVTQTPDLTPLVVCSVTAMVVVILIIVVMGGLWRRKRRRKNTSKQVSDGGAGDVAEHSVPVGEYDRSKPRHVTKKAPTTY